MNFCFTSKKNLISDYAKFSKFMHDAPKSKDLHLFLFKIAIKIFIKILRIITQTLETERNCNQTSKI